MQTTNVYVLFKCLECGKYKAWPERTADGHRCDCGGQIKPIDKGTKPQLRQKYRNIFEG